MTAIAKLTLPHGHDAILRAAGVNHITSEGVVTSPANWEANNIVRASLPAPIRFEDTPGKTTDTIRIHKNLKTSLEQVMAQVHRNHPESYAKILFSGSFNPRAKRGQANAFSMHSLGYAIDFNSSVYGFQPGHARTLDSIVPYLADVLRTFKAYDWKLGADFGDIMHVQGGDGY